VLVAAAALIALTIAGLAVALDSSSQQTPQPVGTSLSTTSATSPTPSSTSPTTATAADEQPPQKPGKRGNGHGKKKGDD
jgi:hypothetical protein